MSKKIYYFDNASTTPSTPKVRSDIYTFLREYWYNPSSNYEQGRKVKVAINRAREQIADYVGGGFAPDEIHFCSTGSESDNLAIQGYFKANKDCKVLITTPYEHSALHKLIPYLKEQGIEVKIIPVDKNGIIDLEKYHDIVDAYNDHYEKVLVSVMLANNETGSINPVALLGDDIKHPQLVTIHTDISQFISHGCTEEHLNGVDMFSFTGHKLNVPRGVAVLGVRNSVKLEPLIYGGQQEGGLIPGTENQAFIMALGNQCERLKKKEHEKSDEERFYRQSFIKTMKFELKDCDVQMDCNVDLNKTVPDILSVRFEGLDNGTLLSVLTEHGVLCSKASACESFSKQRSYTLKAIGLTDEQVDSSLRFSFSDLNSLDEVIEGAKIAAKAVKTLAKMR